MTAQERLLSASLALASGALQLRDAVRGVTRWLRRHPLAEGFYFESHGRRLAGVFVPGEPGLPVVLLCHGIGETAEHWSATGSRLWRGCCAAVVEQATRCMRTSYEAKYARKWHDVSFGEADQHV